MGELFRIGDRTISLKLSIIMLHSILARHTNRGGKPSPFRASHYCNAGVAFGRLMRKSGAGEGRCASPTSVGCRRWDAWNMPARQSSHSNSQSSLILFNLS